MEALADAVRLRALGLGSGVVDVLDREVELILVPLGAAAILGAAVVRGSSASAAPEHPAQLDFVLVEVRRTSGAAAKRCSRWCDEGHHAVVQQVGRRDRGFAVIQLGKRHLAVGVDKGLLVDPSHALHGADVEGILRPAVAWALAFELAVRLTLSSRLLEGSNLSFREEQAVLRAPCQLR